MLETLHCCNLYLGLGSLDKTDFLISMGITCLNKGLIIINTNLAAILDFCVASTSLTGPSLQTLFNRQPFFRAAEQNNKDRYQTKLNHKAPWALQYCVIFSISKL